MNWLFANEPGTGDAEPRDVFVLAVRAIGAWSCALGVYWAFYAIVYSDMWARLNHHFNEFGARGGFDLIGGIILVLAAKPIARVVYWRTVKTSEASEH
jgi:hypothetical protein